MSGSIRTTRPAEIIVTCLRFSKMSEEKKFNTLIDVEQFLNEKGGYEAEDLITGEKFRVGVRVHMK